MPNLLYLFLDDIEAIEQAESLVLGSDGNILSELKPRPIEELQILQQKSNLIIILPSTIVTTHIIKLPTLKKAELLVPNLLEEEVIDEIEKLHFCLDKNSTPEKTYRVQVISKQYMENLINKLKALKLTAAQVCSDICLNAQPSLLLGADYAQLSTATHIGALRANLLAKLEQPDLSNVKVHHFSDADPELLSSIAHIADVKMIEKEERYKEYIAKSLSKKSSLNLASGNYKLQSTASPVKKYIGAPVLALALIFYIGANLFHYHRVSHQLTEVTEKNFATYKKVFPNAAFMIEPRFRIERALQNNQANQQSPFFILMQIVAPIFAKHHDLNVTSLNYQGDSLTASFQVASFSELDDLQQKLQSQSININQLSATTKKNIVNAVWRLSL